MTIAANSVQIADLWKAGASIDKIADNFPALSTRTLRRKIDGLKASGEIDDRSPVLRDVWTPRLIERLRFYATNGKTTLEISTLIGVSRTTLTKKLRELAVDEEELADSINPHYVHWSSEKIEEFVGLWITGIETKTIAVKYEVTESAIRKRAASMYRNGDLRMVARGNQTTSQRKKSLLDIPEFPSTPIPAMPALPNSRRLTLEELRPRDCRWIDDDDLYCGLTITRGSYCACHAKIVYVTPSKGSNLYSNMVRDNPFLNYTGKGNSKSMHGAIKSLAIFEAEDIVSPEV